MIPFSQIIRFCIFCKYNDREVQLLRTQIDRSFQNNESFLVLDFYKDHKEYNQCIHKSLTLMTFQNDVPLLSLYKIKYLRYCIIVINLFNTVNKRFKTSLYIKKNQISRAENKNQILTAKDPMHRKLSQKFAG